VAVILFGLEVHGRRMEDRSSQERIVIALLAVILIAILAIIVIHSRTASVVTASASVKNTSDATSTHPSNDLVNPTAGANTVTGLVATQPLQAGQPTSSSSDGESVRVDTAPLVSSTDATATSHEDQPPVASNSEPSRRRSTNCSESNTGHYGFTNNFGEKTYSVALDYDQEEPARRTIMVPPGETQTFYDVPAGRHEWSHIEPWFPSCPSRLGRQRCRAT